MSSFAKIVSSAALVVTLAAPAFAHMRVLNPPPLRAKENPFYKDSNLVDYSATTPITDGRPYPCLGYHVDVPGVSQAVDTLHAGQNYTITLDGSATHGGGQCEFAVSYDGAKTWGVIYTVPSDCPNAKSYSFIVPADLPSGKNILMAWSWWNKVGNREMYMNCIAMDVESSSTAPITLPKMFEANIYGSGTCNTIEGQDIDFSNPQLDNCPADKLVTPDKRVTISSNGSAPAPPSSDPTSSAPPVSSPTETATEPSDPCPEEPETDTGSVPTPTSAPPTTPPPSSGSGAWEGGKVYIGGDKACQGGVEYTAKWWTMGETPGNAEVWTAGGAC